MTAINTSITKNNHGETMSKLRKLIKKKLIDKHGMSLTELLSAVLILSLVSGAMAGAVSLAANQYDKSMRNSEASVLYSTLANILENELAYTTDIRVESLTDGKGTVKCFFSPNYAIQQSLSSLITDKSGKDGYGMILLGNIANPDESIRVLGSGAYPNGLLAKVKEFTYDNNTCCFTVYLSIGYDGTECFGGTFQVINVNKTQATVG